MTEKPEVEKVESEDLEDLEENQPDEKDYKALWEKDSKALKGSSKEAIRLKHENEDFKKKLEEAEKVAEKVKPFMEAYEKDPKFAEHISNYGKTVESAETKYPELGANLEYFDMSEALSNPNSPSGKYLKERDLGLVNTVLDKRLSQYEGDRQFETKLGKDRIEWLRNHPEKSEQDAIDLEAKAKLFTPTYDQMIGMIYDKPEKEVVTDKPRNPYAYPSVASKASELQPPNNNDKFMKAIEGAGLKDEFSDLT